MSDEIWVDVVVRSLTDPERCFEIQAFVDSGSTDSAMPAKLLASIGVEAEGTDVYKGWEKKRMRRRWAYVRFDIGGRSGIGRVTFEPKDEYPTIGATTLEHLGFDIDMANGGLRPFSRRGPTIRLRPSHPLPRAKKRGKRSAVRSGSRGAGSR
ncbi:MAG: hypothetical protein HY720_28915 [Planctomycetes bacterium]|nr:hypothetical protein [Planctomycetota bacterium]